MLEALITRYEFMKREAIQGSREQHAYHKIIQALQADDPEIALEEHIQSARDAIVRHDQNNWNSREGYRGYYTDQIKLYTLALGEIEFSSIETDLCDLPKGWHLLVKVRIEEKQGHVWQPVPYHQDKPGDGEVYAAYFEAMRRILTEYNAQQLYEKEERALDWEELSKEEKDAFRESAKAK